MSQGNDAIAARRAELERRLAALSPAKRALLDRGVDAPAVQGAGQADAGAIQPRAAGAPVPMSYAQELFWRLEVANPGHAYNVPRVARLKGALDHAALQRALDALLVRHETLRTTFTEVNGEPRQLIHAPRTVPLDVVDLSNVPAQDREPRAIAKVKELTRRPFNLATDLQLRVTVVQLSVEDNVLVLESHHVVSDAMSRGILLRELAALYQEQRTGTPAALKPLAVQYGDFALWQREHIAGARLDAQLGYWRTKLAQLPPLELPTDHPRSAAPTFEGATRARAFSPELQAAVRQFSESRGVTTFMTVLAAFDLLLARYSGQDDIVVGSPITGRTQPEVEGIIGCFLNTLVLRTSVADDPTFAQLIGRVRDTVLGAFEHQEVPYEKLVLDLHQQGRISSEPLYSVGFSFHDPDGRPLALDGTTVVPFGADRGATKSDITLNVTDSARGFRASIAYRTELFDEATIDRMLGHLGELLASAVAQPEIPVSALRMITPAEREQVVMQWNATSLPYDRSLSLTELVRTQAALTADAPAVRFNGDVVSYRALDERVARVTSYLKERGVGEDSVVALYVERSIDMVVAMLAIHRAGAAYLPLDPSYPRERLEFMLEDSGARVVITEESLRTQLPLAHATVVSVDGDRAVIASSAPDSAAAPGGPERTAYLIYTSGSTGKPKGVAVTHRNVVNFLAGLGQEVPLRTGDVLVSVTPLSFDISVLEVFHPLTSGAQLVVAPRESALDPQALGDLLVASRATHMQATPATWRMLIDAGWEGKSGLIALCGGEALPPALAAALLSRGLVLWNMYGPTEATIWATMHRVGGDDVGAESAGGAALPIGKPMANVQAYILDGAGQPVPIGVAGELLLGGDGIARGYHNRPELTAERFVRDPFSALPGARLYRTGDHARWRADGVIQFLGRLDQQVKLRGHRIEMGEIEHALAALEGVSAAAAVVREDRPGDARLVAYVVGPQLPAEEDGRSLRISDRYFWSSGSCHREAGALRGVSAVDAETAASWRSALAAQLPDYMVPQAFVRLARFPLTPNGKLDRKALPMPPSESNVSAASHVAARTPTEARMVGIWEEVLQHRPIGVHDEFFSIGGHSLLALRVIARVAQSEGVRLPLRALFETPTVAGFAARVEKERHGGNIIRDEPIPAHHQPVAPMAPAQELLWLLQRTNPELSAYNIVDQWSVQGEVDPTLLQRALDLLVERHSALRTTFGTEHGQPVQRVNPPRPVQLQVVDVSADADPDAAASRAAREFGTATFDLSHDLLLRACLIRVSGGESRVLVMAHHIVYDGWSRGIVQREISEAYEAFRRNDTPRLAPLPVSYGDYAAWAHGRMQGPARDQQLAYWTERLRGATFAVDLPTDRARGGAQSFAGGRRTVVLPNDLLDRLRALARTQDATLFSVLLAAFQTLLHRYGGQEQVVVGTVIAGRPRRELEDVVGYFVNTLALDASFGDDPLFTDVARRVRDGWLSASENAEVPFEYVADALTRTTGQSYAPSCQVMFAMQNNARTALQLADATLRGAVVDTGTAKFDLYLSVGEQPNGLRATLQYRSDLFDDATIEHMLAHLTALLNGVAAAPGTRVSELPLLRHDERARILEQLSGSRTEYPRDALVHELFREVARGRPDAMALMGETGSLTYAALDEKSDAIAGALTSMGVSPGTLVALCAERSIAMVVGILGILKAGGAYVPLDPSYPAARLAYMLRDAASPVLVVQHELTELAEAIRGNADTTARVLEIDSSGTATSAFDASVHSGPDNDAGSAERSARPAYVMYTSGSTGTPKGVLVPHRAIVRLVRNTTFAALDEQQTLLAFAPAAFDASTLELWGALLNGGRLAIAPAGLVELSTLGDVVERYGVTTMWLTAALFQQVVDAGLDRYRGVRQLLSGGDVLSSAHVRRALEALPHTRIINGYGPTENTTFTTCFTVPREWPMDAPLPIGYPIANTTGYVLDARRQPVPVGVAGELYAGGDGVALGYLNQPELTHTRFVADPFSASPGARMYRTGDRVRWRPDGALEFLGRMDQQVKIRGFRVEPGEVETMLAGHPGIREAVVVVKPAPSGGQQLIGYFVPVDPASSLTVASLKAYLRERLPDYMVPSAIMQLQSMPVGTTGKVDRRALPMPSPDALEDSHAYVAPRNDTEERVAQIWAEVLGLERVGVDRDFFDLGGHSLSAMRIVSRVLESFGVTLPLTMVFERPTVADMAVLVIEQQGAVKATPAIRRVARTAQRRPAGKSDGTP